MTTMTTADTDSATRNNIIIQINEIDQLFNAPAINAFSVKPIDVAGESALSRIGRQMLARAVRKSDDTRLVIQLPSDQITPNLQASTTEAVRRYLDARIEDNGLSVRIARRLGLIELLIASGLAVVALALISLLLAGALANLGSDLRGLILGFVGVLAWVLLWNPLDKLLFGWVEPWEQNAILRKIKAMDIVIEPTTRRGDASTQAAR